MTKAGTRLIKSAHEAVELVQRMRVADLEAQVADLQATLGEIASLVAHQSKQPYMHKPIFQKKGTTAASKETK